jgi:hypothetical protein
MTITVTSMDHPSSRLRRHRTVPDRIPDEREVAVHRARLRTRREHPLWRREPCWRRRTIPILTCDQCATPLPGAVWVVRAVKAPMSDSSTRRFRAYDPRVRRTVPCARRAGPASTASGRSPTCRVAGAGGSAIVMLRTASGPVFSCCTPVRPNAPEPPAAAPTARRSPCVANGADRALKPLI